MMTMTMTTAATSDDIDMMQDRVLLLRTTRADGTAHGGFRWPMQVGAIVTAPDWTPEAICKGGLHGLVDGMGASTLLDWSSGALWWVVSVPMAAEVIDLGGTAKVSAARVEIFGDRDTVTRWLLQRRPTAAVHGVTVSGGDRSAVRGGDRSAVAGGDRSAVRGGDRSAVTGGYRSAVTGGDRSAVAGGDRSAVAGGYRSAVTGGNRSAVRGGYESTVTGGDGSAVAGGNCSTVSGGVGSTVSGGVGSVLILRDARNSAYVAIVGQGGILPHVPYCLVDGQFVAAY